VPAEPDRHVVIDKETGFNNNTVITIMVTPTIFCFYQFFPKSLGILDTEGLKNNNKYRDAFPNYCFQPIAVENLGAMNSSAVDFINTLGRHISSVSGEDKESAFLFQRISVAIQRFNSILLFESFPHDDHDQ